MSRNLLHVRTPIHFPYYIHVRNTTINQRQTRPLGTKTLMQVFTGFWEITIPSPHTSQNNTVYPIRDCISLWSSMGVRPLILESQLFACTPWMCYAQPPFSTTKNSAVPLSYRKIGPNRLKKRPPLGMNMLASYLQPWFGIKYRQIYFLICLCISEKLLNISLFLLQVQTRAVHNIYIYINFTQCMTFRSYTM